MGRWKKSNSCQATEKWSVIAGLVKVLSGVRAAEKNNHLICLSVDGPKSGATWIIVVVPIKNCSKIKGKTLGGLAATQTPSL
jgi:hypothetical protein